VRNLPRTSRRLDASFFLIEKKGEDLAALRLLE